MKAKTDSNKTQKKKNRNIKDLFIYLFLRRNK
jgi:hypothetical protein